MTFLLTVIFDLVKAIAVGMVLHYAIKLIQAKIAQKTGKTDKTEMQEVDTDGLPLADDDPTNDLPQIPEEERGNLQ